MNFLGKIYRLWPVIASALGTIVLAGTRYRVIEFCSEGGVGPLAVLISLV